MSPLQATMAVTMTCRKVCVDAPLSTVALMYLTKLPAATRAMLAEMPIIGYTVLASFTVQTSLARVQKSTAMTTLPQSSAVQKNSEYVQFSTTLMRPCRPGTMWGDTWMERVALCLRGCQGGPWLQDAWCAAYPREGYSTRSGLQMLAETGGGDVGVWDCEARELVCCKWR